MADKLKRKIDKGALYAHVAFPVIIGLVCYDIQKTLLSGERTDEDLYYLGYRLAAYSAFYPLLGAALLYFRRKNLDPLKKESVKKILEEIFNQESPELQAQKKIKVEIGLKDILYTSFLGGADSHPIFRKLDRWYALKTKNPLFLASAARGHFQLNEFDEGFSCLRDIADMLDGSLPYFDKFTKIGIPFEKLANKFDRLYMPFSPDSYFKRAMTCIFSNPEEVWKWTLASAKISKEFEEELYPHYLTLHALFATTQKRSDEQLAWENALKEIERGDDRNYLGESQNPVWTPKGDFLKSTLVIKGDSSRENLLLEMKGARTLEKILQNAEAPKPLFVSNQLINGTYIYVMRTSKGETLYEKFEKNDYSGISSVEDVLSQIHAKYPLEGLNKLNLEQKILKKTKDMKLEEDFANSLFASTEPVRKAIIETANWAAAKDAHPENWIISHTLHPIDTLFKEIQPTNLDLANLYNYGEYFAPDEKRMRVKNYDFRFSSHSKKERKPNQILFREYWNAEIQRAIDLTAAWITPKRKTRHPHIIPLLGRAQLSIQNLKQDDLSYYEQNQEKYTQLNKLLDKLKEHVTPYIS